ncbi:remorin 4.1 isoform X2 [Dendrobium catenatum]|uniref:Remorin n=1 Tax=Dendrobium catenatum TaxID=906689 RepID=A0A2I0WVP6_9ASPA|nr:remorin 4.1 isoform X2 [Dendrobium catenatum]PKU79738.1 Remorin [Dendrobium catenatum]
MSEDPRAISSSAAASASTAGAADEFTEIREIHALNPPQAPPTRGRTRDPWEVASHRSTSLSVGSEVENFTSMSREFNAMVVAGSNLQIDTTAADGSSNLGRIGEDVLEETNPLAIVPDTNPPFPSPRRPFSSSSSVADEVSVHRVKKDEVNAKILAWQGAEIAKVNNRFKRVDVTINGWESEQIERATALFKKIELEEKRARAMEKMQNDVARAHRKAEDKRASAEAKRGMKVARVLEVANLLRAVGRAPSKRSFF